jgi:hypothetical protein
MADYCRDESDVVARWQELNTKTLPALNIRLHEAHLAPLPAMSAQDVAPTSCGAR